MAFYKNVPERSIKDHAELHDFMNSLETYHATMTKSIEKHKPIEEVEDNKKAVTEIKKTKKKIRQKPSSDHIDSLHFKRMFNPYWEFEQNSNKGIRNAGHTCHLNVMIQFIFSLEDIVIAIRNAASLGLVPSVYFNEVFQVLDEINPETSASAAKLITYYKIDTEKDYDAVETLEMILHSLHENLIQVDFNLLGLFTHNYYSGNEKILSAIRIPLYKTDIGKATQNIMKFNTFPSPKILYVHLMNPTSERPKLTVPMEFLADRLNEKPEYMLYSITAYAPKHYVQFFRKDDKWIARNDEYCYDIPENIIKDLFGADKDYQIYAKTQQHLRAYILFFIKKAEQDGTHC